MVETECPSPRYMNGQFWTVFGIFSDVLWHPFVRIRESRHVFAVLRPTLLIPKGKTTDT